MADVPSHIWWIGQVLLLAMYSSQITNGCSKRVLMMCGEEKRLLLVSLAEAGANVALSIILAYRIGVLGVAIGTMIPTILVGWLWVVPMTVRKLDLSFRSYLSSHLRDTLLPLAVFAAILSGLALWCPASDHSGFLALGWRGLLCMVPLLVLGRKVIREMTGS
jgi:O-antigen/teichoic acid export membrane protein